MRAEEITIRRMRPEDVAAASELEARVFSMPWSGDAFLEMTEAENAIYLVVEYRAEIVGICGVRNILGEGEVTNVAVSPEYRRNGIAGKMMSRLLSEGEQAGIEAFTLEVRKSNLPAIALYQSLGFVTEGIRPRFYEKPAEDALVMWKR